MESRQRKLIRSLRFKLCLVLACIGILYTGFSCYRAYHKTMESIGFYVDEELAQIASVVVNYDMILPKTWQAPSFKRRIFKAMNGHIMLSRGFENPFLPIPSLNDLFDKHQEIIIAPIYSQPGETFYFPSGIEDGLYSVLINDRRVRAYVATNRANVRFVVARPFELMEALVNQAMLNSFYEFALLVLLYIPCMILFVHVMFIPVKRLAKELDARKESDLTPVTANKLPSELDVFIDSINRLFLKTSGALANERRFIADAAHEMRTPLTAISLQAQSLKEELLPDEEEDKVHQLKQAITRQRKLTNDLLAFARSQCGHELKLSTFYIKDLFVEVIDDLGSLADNKDIDLGLIGECTDTITTDRTTLKSIVSNLVSNALKYTQNEGQVDLTCYQEKEHLHIVVQDNGPGISEDDLKKVFNAFYRVGGDTAKIEGSGLGLSIVKSACDELDAKIELSNRKEGGLKALITLPKTNQKNAHA